MVSEVKWVRNTVISNKWIRVKSLFSFRDCIHIVCRISSTNTTLASILRFSGNCERFLASYECWTRWLYWIYKIFIRYGSSSSTGVGYAEPRWATETRGTTNHSLRAYCETITILGELCAGCILCIKTLFQYYLFCILEICSLHNIVGLGCFVRYSEIPEKGFCFIH